MLAGTYRAFGVLTDELEMASIAICIKCNQQLIPNALFCPHCGVKVAQENLSARYNDPYLGTTIDNTFIVDSILGTGSMGIVYKARHRALDCHVAIKILKHDYLDNALILTRFQREAQAASGIQHPNVIRILHYGKTVLNAPYIAMECLEGEDLSDIIVRDFPFSQHRIANIILQVARALGAAHDARIIHRDLKPANIKVIPQMDGTDLIKVLDFGIAKITDDGGEGLTREGTICGTPAFMSPEQVLGKTVTPAADIFSLGSIMYFMLTCKLPFEGSSLVDMASSILTTQITPPSRVRLDAYVDPQLEAICLKALSKDTASRYQNGRELENALSTIIPSLTEANDANARKSCVVVMPDIDELPDIQDPNKKTQCEVPVYDSIFGINNPQAQSHPTPPQDMQANAQLNVGSDDNALDFETNIADSGECTRIDQSAFDAVDEGEGATQIAMPAATDDAYPDMPFVAPNAMTARPLQGNMASAPFRSPNPLPYGSQAFMNPMTNHARMNEDEKKHKKMLLLLIIALVTTVCVILILVVSILSIKTSDPQNKSVADSPSSISANAERRTDGAESGDTDDMPEKAKEKTLSAFDMVNIVDNVVHTCQDELYIIAAYGLYYGSGQDGASAGSSPSQSNTDATSDKTAVAQKDTASSKPSAASKKKTETASSKKTASSSGGGIKKKLAEADKLFSSGKTAKACAIYRTIVNDKSLSKTDKLAIQGKIRRCSRVL